MNFAQKHIEANARSRGTYSNLGNVFVPDVILPAQQGRRYVRADPSVLALMAAVLEEAIRNAAGLVVCCSSPRRRLAVTEEARAWLLSPDDDYAFACRTICGSLGIDSDAFQAEVRAGLVRDVRRFVGRRSMGRGARVNA